MKKWPKYLVLTQISSPKRSADIATADMGFHTTHWTVVLTARAEQGTAAGEALAHLCSSYWYPLYAFVRRQVATPEEAEDLTQEFFLRFLDGKALVHVEPAAGKFRSFLLACVKNFLANQRERAGAQRRGGGRVRVPLENQDPETRYSLELADNLTPEVLFEREWAFALLERTMARLREEYERADKRELFDQLQGFLPGSQGAVTRTELAAKRGVSPGAINVAVHRVRQRFGALLREEVAQTVGSADEVKPEIRYLLSVLAGS